MPPLPPALPMILHAPPGDCTGACVLARPGSCSGRSPQTLVQPKGRGREPRNVRVIVWGLSNPPATECACSLLPWWRRHLGWRNETFNYCLRSKQRAPLETWQVLSNARGSWRNRRGFCVLCSTVRKGSDLPPGLGNRGSKICIPALQPVRHPLV